MNFTNVPIEFFMTVCKYEKILHNFLFNIYNLLIIIFLNLRVVEIKNLLF